MRVLALLCVLLVVPVVAAPVSAQATGGWSPLGGGVKGYVSALARGPDGSVYAGGGIPAGRVARWDGAAWRPLGSGIGGSGYIDALAAGPDGSVYVAGDFAAAGGVLAEQIARWDGAAWSALGSGVAGGFLHEVYSLAVGPDGVVYAGGRNYNEPEDGVVRWDGTSWGPVGGGLTGNVWALAFGPDGALYAGGEFLRTSEGAEPAGVATWDGTSWHALGSGIGGGFDPTVLSLAVAPGGTVYAGGFFTTIDGVPARNIARWDGAAWNPMVGGPTGVGNQVDALALGQDGSVYAGSGFTPADRNIVRWNGTAWSSLGGVDGGGGPHVIALATASNGDVFVGGSFDTAGGVASPNVARYTPGPVASEPSAGPVGALSLVVSPNPARGAAVATVTHAGGPLTVEVVDALGRRVAVVTEGDAPAGRREVALALGGLAPGVYGVRVTAGRETLTRSVAVVR